MTFIETPLIPFFENQSLLMKPENLQPFGSYKIRGVQNFFNKNLQQLKNRGLIVASAGNMAQAVAYYANSFKIDYTIYIPDSAPLKKKLALAQLGANIVEKPFSQIWNLVKNGYDGPEIFLHPALSSDLTDGYASLAEEIAHSDEKITSVVIPFGVGGLITGIASTLLEMKSSIKIYAAEIQTAAPLHESLLKGKASSIHHQKSFVDAIGTPEVLPLVFENLHGKVEQSVVVSLEETKEMIHSVLTHHSMLIEGAAGVALAAAQKISLDQEDGKIVVILSGGNLDRTHLLPRD